MAVRAIQNSPLALRYQRALGLPRSVSAPLLGALAK